MKSRIKFTFLANGNLSDITDSGDKIFKGQVAATDYYLYTDELTTDKWLSSDLVYINFRRPDNQTSQVLMTRSTDGFWIYTSNGWETDCDITEESDLYISFTMRRYSTVGSTTLIATRTTEQMAKTIYPSSAYIPQDIESTDAERIDAIINQWSTQKMDRIDATLGEEIPSEITYNIDGEKTANIIYFNYEHAVTNYDAITATVTGDLLVVKDETLQAEYLFATNGKVYFRTISLTAGDFQEISKVMYDVIDARLITSENNSSEALSTANEAKSIAENAESVANGIDAKATEALSNSETAVSTADEAKATADGIDAKATDALENSEYAVETADEAKAIALSVEQAKVFDTFEDMETWLKDEANKGLHTTGLELLIKSDDVPDYWVTAVLENPNASGYYYDIEATEATVLSVNNKKGIVVLKTDDISDENETNKWSTAEEKEKVSKIVINGDGTLGLLNDGTYGVTGKVDSVNNIAPDEGTKNVTIKTDNISDAEQTNKFANAEQLEQIEINTGDIEFDRVFNTKFKNPENTVVLLKGKDGATPTELYLWISGTSQTFTIYRSDGTSEEITAFTGEYVNSHIFPDDGYYWVIIESSNGFKNMPYIYVNNQADKELYYEARLTNLLPDTFHRAFLQCLQLRKITIPNTITTIDEEAFSVCVKLEEIILPQTPEGLGFYHKDAFKACHSIKELVFPKSTTNIGETVLWNSKGLERIIILRKNPPTIHPNAFDVTTCPIYVPYESLTAYKEAINWSTYADRIFPIPEGKWITEELAQIETNAGDITDLQNNKADKATTLTGYGITDAYTKTEIESKIASVYKYKGSVESYASLPAEDLTVGDVYNVEDTGDNYAWTGTEWDKLAGTIDLSNYATKSQLDGGLDLKFDKAGGTITGDTTFNAFMKIVGTAADRHLLTRGIGGASTDGLTADDLYINYGVDFGARFGKTGQSRLKPDGGANFAVRPTVGVEEVAFKSELNTQSFSKVYKSLSDLTGITTSSTLAQVCDAMVDNSYLNASTSGYEGLVPTGEADLNGQLEIIKVNANRVRLAWSYQNASRQPIYFATYRNTGGFLGWKRMITDTEDQTITGVKTFAKDIILDNGSADSSVSFNLSGVKKGQIRTSTASTMVFNAGSGYFFRPLDNSPNGIFLNPINNGHIRPEINNFLDLGSINYKWKDVYVQGSVFGAQKEFTATLSSSDWTGTSAPYSKEVTVSGILATDKPGFDLNLNGVSYANIPTIQSAWFNVYRRVASADKITFYAHEIPSIDIPLTIKVVR